MKTIDMIKVMQHYREGGDVECAVKGNSNWEIVTKPLWNWGDCEYRIKEQKQKITVETWLCKSGENSFYIYVGTDADGLDKVKLLGTCEIELKEDK